jgi:hypothetical protein
MTLATRHGADNMEPPAYSVVTDFVCALLPVVVLWRVKISARTKVGVCGLMALGLIATAVAIVRASSLGIKTADLSYDYCIAAIWANTELHLGIIATNLSLSRMIWACLVGRDALATSNAMKYGTGTNASRNRAGYVKSEDRTAYSKGEEALRISLDNRSQASDIPLEPVIKRTTSVYVTYKASSDKQGAEERGMRWT